MIEFIKGVYLWFLWLWNSGHDPESGRDNLKRENELFKDYLNNGSKVL